MPTVCPCGAEPTHAYCCPEFIGPRHHRCACSNFLVHERSRVFGWCDHCRRTKAAVLTGPVSWMDPPILRLQALGEWWRSPAGNFVTLWSQLTETGVAHGLIAFRELELR